MRLNFRELLPYTQAVDIRGANFVFVSKTYAFSAAEMFSEHLARKLGQPVTYLLNIGDSSEDQVALYSTSDSGGVDTLLQTLPVPHQGICIYSITLSESRTNLSKLAGIAVVVDVDEPTAKTAPADMSYVCQLVNVPHDEEGVKGLSSKCDLCWGSFKSSALMWAEKYQGVLGSANYNVLEDVQPGTYEHFRDKALFGACWEASIVMQEAGPDCMEYTTRFINDLSVYHTMLVLDEAKHKLQDIARIFGMNEWFLKTKLMPRLRVLKRARILVLMDKMSEAYKLAVEGSVSSIPLTLASTVLLGLR